MLTKARGSLHTDPIRLAVENTTMLAFFAGCSLWFHLQILKSIVSDRFYMASNFGGRGREGQGEGKEGEGRKGKGRDGEGKGEFEAM